MAETTKLTPKSRNIIEDANNILILGSVSIWEIAIKTSLKKLEFNIKIEDLQTELASKSINILEPNMFVYTKIQSMPYYKIDNVEHRDPFDRMLIAQAITESIPIISADTKFDLYPEILKICKIFSVKLCEKYPLCEILREKAKKIRNNSAETS